MTDSIAPPSKRDQIRAYLMTHPGAPLRDITRGLASLYDKPSTLSVELSRLRREGDAMRILTPAVQDGRLKWGWYPSLALIKRGAVRRRKRWRAVELLEDGRVYVLGRILMPRQAGLVRDAIERALGAPPPGAG